MSVVQRCPNCGTTSPSPGECEACHEAQVRYFCTNHTPGLWLAASTCDKCGARFGEPARHVSARAPAVPSRAPAPSRAPMSRSGAPPYSRSRPPAATRAWDGRARPPSADEDELGPRSSRMAPWQKLLLAAARSHYMAPRAARAHERLPVRRAAGGCLMRLGLLMVLLFVALAGGAFVFGRALLQGF